jgi:hypothetical protein
MSERRAKDLKNDESTRCALRIAGIEKVTQPLNARRTSHGIEK